MEHTETSQRTAHHVVNTLCKKKKMLSGFYQFKAITPVQWYPPKVMGRSLKEELQVLVDITWTWVSLALSPGLQVVSHHIVLRSLSQILLELFLLKFSLASRRFQSWIIGLIFFLFLKWNKCFVLGVMHHHSEATTRPHKRYFKPVYPCHQLSWRSSFGCPEVRADEPLPITTLKSLGNPPWF